MPGLAQDMLGHPAHPQPIPTYNHEGSWGLLRVLRLDRMLGTPTYHSTPNTAQHTLNEALGLCCGCWGLLRERWGPQHALGPPPVTLNNTERVTVGAPLLVILKCVSSKREARGLNKRLRVSTKRPFLFSGAIPDKSTATQYVSSRREARCLKKRPLAATKRAFLLGRCSGQVHRDANSACEVGANARREAGQKRAAAPARREESVLSPGSQNLSTYVSSVVSSVDERTHIRACGLAGWLRQRLRRKRTTTPCMLLFVCRMGAQSQGI